MVPMVRLRVAELLKARGESRYAFSREVGLTQPRAYRLSAPDGAFDRLEAGALNALCAYFGVQPGELLEWVPDPPKRGRKA
jgi:DNA-binding Xre family transcriptional regulator